MEELKTNIVNGRYAVMTLKNIKPISFLLFVLVCISSCGPLGPWNKPKFNEFEWSRMEINYSIIINDDTYLQRNFLLSDTKSIKDGMPRMVIKHISGSMVPTSHQMHWQTASRERWYANFYWSQSMGFTKKGHKLYYAYYVDLENSDFYNWIRQQCLKDAQKDFPEITLASIVLYESGALKLLGYKSLKILKPINENTQNYIVDDNDADKNNRAYALKSFEHYESDGNLKPIRILENEFIIELEKVQEIYDEMIEKRKELGLEEK